MCCCSLGTDVDRSVAAYGSIAEWHWDPHTSPTNKKAAVVYEHSGWLRHTWGSNVCLQLCLDLENVLVPRTCVHVHSGSSAMHTRAKELHESQL